MLHPISIKVTGVPEHFNLPWHLAKAAQAFEKEGISLHWQDAPGGTGAMMQALQTGDADVAIALTEGVVASIAKGTEAKIVQLYVSSPLSWGIHVAGHSGLHDVKSLEGRRFAISRPTSGSHLMAYVLGRQQGWDTEKMQFVEVGGMDGARKALANDAADVFMWEKFMTKPIVDRGEFRRVGEIDTPWPCFVVAASNAILDKHPDALQRMLSVINQASSAFSQRHDAAALVAKGFDLQEEDAREWLARTKWANDSEISVAMLEQVLDTLSEVGAIATKPAVETLCGPEVRLKS